MFEDKIHKEVAAALAGDCFATLQEAIDKAQIVEEKLMGRDARPTYDFLKGFEPNSKIQTFEASLDQGQSDETIVTLLKEKRKRG